MKRDTQHNSSVVMQVSFMLNVANKSSMLKVVMPSVFMLSVSMLSVVAPKLLFSKLPQSSMPVIETVVQLIHGYKAMETVVYK